MRLVWRVLLKYLETLYICYRERSGWESCMTYDISGSETASLAFCSTHVQWLDNQGKTTGVAGYDAGLNSRTCTLYRHSGNHSRRPFPWHEQRIAIRPKKNELEVIS